MSLVKKKKKIKRKILNVSVSYHFHWVYQAFKNIADSVAVVIFKGRKKVISFPFGISTRFVILDLERTTVTVSLVVFEF